MMKRLLTSTNFLLLFIAIASLFYFGGLTRVPFHPDESTQIYMSADFSTYTHNPSSLAWRPGTETDARMRYRLIDAPLTRYLVGLFRTILKVPDLPADWNWGLTWEENVQNGALPDTYQLMVSRLACAIFFPLCLWLIFDTTRRIGNLTAGWTAAVLYATSALVLLHTRRAMAEGPLLFFILLSLWTLVAAKKRAWLGAIPLALAFNAKYSPAPLVIAGVLAVAWSARRKPWYETVEEIGIFGVIFIAITFLLNPFLWQDPVQAAFLALSERKALVSAQVFDIISIRPDLAMPGWIDRFQVHLVQLFFAPTAVQDVGNYTAELKSSSNAYFANPLNNLWRGFAGGAILLALTLVGLIKNIVQLFSKNLDRRGLAIILTAGVAQLAGLSLLIPLPFQRYSIIMLPYVCIWSALAVGQLPAILHQARKKNKQAA